jgi:hypothetical protein
VLSRESARVAQMHTEFDSSALLRALPQFRYTPLEQVIKESCAHYLQMVKEAGI